MISRLSQIHSFPAKKTKPLSTDLKRYSVRMKISFQYLSVSMPFLYLIKEPYKTIGRNTDNEIRGIALFRIFVAK
jgi:hypothetical protein